MSIKLKDIKKDFGIKFDGNQMMKLSTWLKKQGYESLGEALEISEKCELDIVKSSDTLTEEDLKRGINQLRSNN